MILTFILFLLIGLASIFSSRNTKQDYYLASKSVAPSLVGLSAVATNNSGFMFIGVIGYTYVTGLATATLWRYAGWQNAVYEGMPGILAGLAVLSPDLFRGMQERVRDYTKAGSAGRFTANEMEISAVNGEKI